MTISTFLEVEEIIALTMRVRRPSQVKVLNAMGIQHKIRPDGSVVILRAHITKEFAGVIAESRATKTKSPNWAAM